MMVPNPVVLRSLAGKTLRLDWQTPVMMGVLNVTPDSFSDGGELVRPNLVVARAQSMVDAGAAILDVGAESTRPGASRVSCKEEWARLRPALEALVAAGVNAALSIDTRNASTAQRALAMGATIINDVGGLTKQAMRQVVAHAGVPAVVMHSRGTPKTMASLARYTCVTTEVLNALKGTLARALDAGIEHHHLWVDPGLGFAKDAQHNLALINDIPQICRLGHPVVVGLSRKRFLRQICRLDAQDDHDKATAAACCVAVFKGTHIVRVHAPWAVSDAIRIGHALRDAERFDTAFRM